MLTHLYTQKNVMPTQLYNYDVGKSVYIESCYIDTPIYYLNFRLL